MRSRSLLAAIVVVLAAAPSLAQGVGRPCDPTGTWIGGSSPDGPGYQLTVTANVGGRYTMMYQSIYNPEMYATLFTGELVRVDAKTFNGSMIATFGGHELDAVREHGRMVDCDTLQFSITWLGVYVSISNATVPFVTLPDVEVIADYLGGEPIVETYHRVLDKGGVPE